LHQSPFAKATGDNHSLLRSEGWNASAGLNIPLLGERTRMRWTGGNRYGVEDRRGMGGVGLAGGGLGAAVLGLIGYFVFGIDPGLIMDAANGLGGTEQQQGRVGAVTDQGGQFVDAVASSTTDTWRDIFSRMGQAYTPPRNVVLYENGTTTACGFGQAAMGPFYCPNDQKVYLDLSFFQELATRFAAPGDFAQAYVIAHEVGHHVQHVLGMDERVRQAQAGAGNEAQANRYSVALELQADCYAGVWAANVDRVTNGKVALEAGDIEEGMRAASAVGDDTLQRQTQGRVVPDSFTHGSSEQRVMWLRRGYEMADPAACDTFSGTP
jgi:predicted metalloprotease